MLLLNFEAILNNICTWLDVDMYDDDCYGKSYGYDDVYDYVDDCMYDYG